MIPLLLTIFSLFSQDLYSNSLPSELNDIIKEKQLYKDPQWIKLLHAYQAFGSDRYNSNIHSSTFFLSKQKPFSPYNEMVATLSEITSLKRKNDNSVYCRFPARYEFLTSNLKLPAKFHKKHTCTNFKRWTKNNSVESISLIFATGYLGNPASYFGHPLLKLNYQNPQVSTNLLDQAINFGAFTPRDENAFIYALKGIFGGYNAGYTSLEFFYHNQDYSEVELRDMWEYELNLTQEQRNLLLNHLWELLEQKFDYYFFKKNCAWAMSNLLEIASGVELLSAKAPYAIPVSLFQSLSDNPRLIKDVGLIASRQTRLKNKLHSLEKPSRQIVKDIIYNPQVINSQRFDRLKLENKIMIIETLFDYTSFFLRQNPKDKKVTSLKKIILLKRLQLPIKETKWPLIIKDPPHKAQRPVMTNIGYAKNSLDQEFVRFRVRPAYYDILSIDTARSKNSALTIFDTSFDIINDELTLNKLILLDAQTWNLSQTQLPGDGSYSWRIKLAAERINLDCTYCLTQKVFGGVGYAFILSEKTNFIIHPGINISYQNNIENSGNIHVYPTLETLFDISPSWRLFGTISQRTYIDKPENKNETLYKISNRFGSKPNWDIRLEYEFSKIHEVNLSYSLYW